MNNPPSVTFSPQFPGQLSFLLPHQKKIIVPPPTQMKAISKRGGKKRPATVIEDDTVVQLNGQIYEKAYITVLLEEATKKKENFFADLIQTLTRVDAILQDVKENYTELNEFIQAFSNWREHITQTQNPKPSSDTMEG